MSARRTSIGARSSFALAALSGLLYWLGFAASHVWPRAVDGGARVVCAFLAMFPLLVALEGKRGRFAFALGATTGLVLSLGGFHWLLEMLRTFSGFPTPLCVVFMVLLCAYQGSRVGLFAWLWAKGTRNGWPRGIVYPLAFATSELVWPLLFPWYFGASVHHLPALSQVADLGGPYLVSLVVASPALALLEAFLARVEDRALPRRLFAACLAVPLFAAGYGAIRVRQVDAWAAAAPPARVGLVQPDMPLIQTSRDHVDGLRKHVAMTRELRRRGADLVVWSEAAIAYNVREDDHKAYLEQSVTGALGVPTIFGAVLVGRDANGRHAFNSALAADAAGKVGGRYDKHYLLAFGEYLPFGDWVPKLYELSPNSGHLSRGVTEEPLEVAGHRALALICYEDILPSFVNGAVRRGRPEMLVNLTNDAWFGDTTEPWIHLALAQSRAIEHHQYLLRATNSGVSAVIDPAGRVIAHGGTFKPEAVEAVAHWMPPRTTVYEVVGDVPWALGALAALAMSVRRRNASAGRDAVA